jgi:hypothetical protein
MNGFSERGYRKHHAGFSPARIIFLILLALFSCGEKLSGEIAPEYYRQWQQQSPEHLLIKTRSVNHPPICFRKSVTVSVEAQVLNVFRSATELQPGRIIKIRYQHFKPSKGWVGPRPLPLLENGKVYHAFLVNDSNNVFYGPAARGYSFSPPLNSWQTNNF